MKYTKIGNKIYEIEKEVDKTSLLLELNKGIQNLKVQRTEKLKEVNNFFDNQEKEIQLKINELKNI